MQVVFVACQIHQHHRVQSPNPKEMPMETLMKMVVRPEANEEVFAIRLSTTIEAFRLSGATRVDILQMGQGSVLVMGLRPATREEEAEREAARAVAFEEEASTALMLAILERTAGLPPEEAARVAMVTAVEMARAWAPSTVRAVHDELEGIIRKFMAHAGPDDFMPPACRMVSALLHGLRLLDPPPTN